MKKAFAAAVLLGAGLGALLTLSPTALAARNSGGTYSSPSADFVSGTVISSSVMNAKLSDLGSEMTDSLSRSGKGGMLARVRGVDGTSALPAYAFTSETTLGHYRAGSGDLRCSSNGTDIQKWTATAITFYQAATAEKGLTVTQSTTNGAGTTSTGNGTGAGVVGTGGATGNGATFNGGATSGAGVVGTGTGGGNGGTFTGQGAGKGVVATGGATGAGGSFTGGAAGDGVRAVGGGTNNSGIYATGGSGGVGGYLEAGTASTGADPTLALTLKSGHLFIDATAPAKDEALTNTITPANMVKAWANVTTDGMGAVTFNDGANITSVAVSGDDLLFTIAGDMANTTYVVLPDAFSSSTANVYCNSKATGTFRLAVSSSSFATSAFTVDVLVVGRQP